MSKREFAVVCSDEQVREAALSVLERGGTATDACTAGFFMASALNAGVVLGAVQLVISGPGVGDHVYDGSMVQPGKGAPRPRGFLDGEQIPDAARIAVSTSVPAIAAAYAFDGSMALSTLSAEAVRVARSRGHRARARFLRRIAMEGPLVLRSPELKRALLDIAARPQRGNLTEQDLDSAVARSFTPLRHEHLLSVPLPDGAVVPVEGRDVRKTVLLVGDQRGVFAGMVTQSEPEGLALDEFELTLSRWAIPVMRGIARTSPETVLHVPSGLAVLVERGVAWGIVDVDTDGPVDWNVIPGDLKGADTGLGERLGSGLHDCCPDVRDYWALLAVGDKDDRAFAAYGSRVSTDSI